MVKCFLLIGAFFIIVQAIYWGALASSALNLAINTRATRRYMGIPARLQLQDWLPGFALAAICTGAPALLLHPLPALPQLGAGLGISLLLYIGILRLTSAGAWRVLVQLLRTRSEP